MAAFNSIDGYLYLRMGFSSITKIPLYILYGKRLIEYILIDIPIFIQLCLSIILSNNPPIRSKIVLS